MSADKRTVSTDALETLGTIIGPNEKRDAIHLAVIPVEAGTNLQPGQHITISGEIAYPAANGKGMAIVDPFLSSTMTHVNAGQRFWAVIYPRVITSLRHVWTHPELPDEPSATRTPGRDASEQWLRNRADSLGISYEEILTAGTNREYPGCFGNDIYGPREIEPEFWIHIQIVTGNAAPADKRPDWFRCAC
jgi:hypothetical protein